MSDSPITPTEGLESVYGGFALIPKSQKYMGHTQYQNSPPDHSQTQNTNHSQTQIQTQSQLEKPMSQAESTMSLFEVPCGQIDVGVVNRARRNRERRRRQQKLKKIKITVAVGGKSVEI